MLMTAGRTIGEMGVVNPALGLWLPNVIFGIAGIVMLIRSANEKPIYWVAGLRLIGGRLAGGIRRLIRRRVRRTT